MISRLQPELRRYAWGSTTALPALLGMPASGEPLAEAWFGAHPTGPSRVTTPGGTATLDDVIRRDPATVLGEYVARRFGGQLPYLVKLLAAASPLSIQAHPTRRQAVAGFAREEASGVPVEGPARVYRDANAKPEVIVALEPFELLYGLREPAASARLLTRLEVAALDDLAHRLRRSTGGQGLRPIVADLCRVERSARVAVVAEVVTACERRSADAGEDGGVFALVARLGRAFPDDVGVVLALLMNHVRLAPYEACFLPARTLHAYVRGVGVEVMGNSDNVVRAGLTTKAVALAELIDIVDFSPCAPDVLRAPATAQSDGRLPLPVEEFAVRLVPVGADPVEVRASSAEILVAVDGAVEVQEAGEAGDRHRLRAGAAVFVDATTARYRLRGPGRVVRVSADAPTGSTEGSAMTPCWPLSVAH